MLVPLPTVASLPGHRSLDGGRGLGAHTQDLPSVPSAQQPTPRLWGESCPIKEFSFCDREATDAEPLVEGPELLTPWDLSVSLLHGPPSRPPQCQHGVHLACSPTPGPCLCPPLFSLDPGPPCCREAGAGGGSGASQHTLHLHFWAQIHSLWSLNICLDQKLSIWSSASMSSPFPPAPSSHALQGELGGNPLAKPLPRGSNLPRAHTWDHTQSPAWGILSLPLPWVLLTISGSIPPASHPKGPSLRLQPLMSRPFQLDPRLRPPSA